MLCICFSSYICFYMLLESRGYWKSGQQVCYSLCESLYTSFPFKFTSKQTWFQSHSSGDKGYFVHLLKPNVK